MPQNKTFLSQLEWRFAVKKFDPEKTVPEETLEKILKAIRLVPTSYGLQPFHVFVVKNKELRKKLRLFSFLQPQVTDASHLLVFCARTDAENRVDQYADLVTGNKLTARAKFAPVKAVMKAAMKIKSPTEMLGWAKRQAYLALGFGLAACAELAVDSCPMEGLQAAAVDKILKLPPHLHSVVYLAVGYRREDPTYPKTRFPESDLFTKID